MNDKEIDSFVKYMNEYNTWLESSNNSKQTFSIKYVKF